MASVDATGSRAGCAPDWLLSQLSDLQSAGGRGWRSGLSAAVSMRILGDVSALSGAIRSSDAEGAFRALCRAFSWCSAAFGRSLINPVGGTAMADLGELDRINRIY